MLVLLLCSRCCPDVVPILLVCLSSMCYVDRVLLLRCSGVAPYDVRKVLFLCYYVCVRVLLLCYYCVVLVCCPKLF